MPDRHCPACGEKLTDSVQYCPSCGEQVTNANRKILESDTDETTWDWTDPSGPFQSPRNALDTLNVIGIAVIGVGLVLTLAGFDSPDAVLASPLDTALLVYVLAVVFVALPLWLILALTDNVLGFLKHKYPPTVETTRDSLLSGNKRHLLHRRSKYHKQREVINVRTNWLTFYGQTSRCEYRGHRFTGPRVPTVPTTASNSDDGMRSKLSITSRPNRYSG